MDGARQIEVKLCQDVAKSKQILPFSLHGRMVVETGKATYEE